MNDRQVPGKLDPHTLVGDEPWLKLACGLHDKILEKPQPEEDGCRGWMASYGRPVQRHAKQSWSDWSSPELMKSK